VLDAYCLGILYDVHVAYVEGNLPPPHLLTLFDTHSITIAAPKI